MATNPAQNVMIASRRLRILTRTVLLSCGSIILTGIVLGPTVLHPLHDRLDSEEVAHAEDVFARNDTSSEDVAVTAWDGTTLRGWKVRAAHPNGDWVLLFHGRSHNRTAMLAYAGLLLPEGYGVVMMDARAHGSSGGAISTYGYLEKYDAHSILNFLESTEHPAHIFALGESMGAAVALQSAAEDSRIHAVVAEGSFSNLREVTFDYAGLQLSETLGKTLFRPIAVIADYESEREAHFRMADVSPERSVASRPFPVLLICGLSDHKIPCRHSEVIYAAATGPKQIWEVARAGHQKALSIAPNQFRDRIVSFYFQARTHRN